MSTSTHLAEVVAVVPRRHENADSLSVVDIDGYSCVIRTEDWVGRSKAVYIPPDSLVEAKRPEFAFLAKDVRADGYVRVKARKLRGVLSFGLLVPAPDDAVLGEDWADRLGVVHYDPEIHSENKNERGGITASGEVASAPNVYHVKYDLEAGRKYAKTMFKSGEPVMVFEKVDGESSRFVFTDGQMHVGSRTTWKKEYPTYSHLNVDELAERMGSVARAEEVLRKLASQPPEQNKWWATFRKYPQLQAFCEAHPNFVVHGELYGGKGGMKYGHQNGELSLALFDIMHNGQFMDSDECEALAKGYNLPWAPLVAGPIPFDFDQICSLAEGKTTFPGVSHPMEGVVVRPVKERRHDRYGRCVLKWVGAGYLERSK